MIEKVYSGCKVSVEESGEQVITGMGELQMDNILKDLRERYAKIEIKMTDPSVAFRETVVDTSAEIGEAQSTNGHNSI